MSAGAWNEPIEADDRCPECERLRVQERAAYLSGDHSRRTDVRLLRKQHVVAEHDEIGSAA